MKLSIIYPIVIFTMIMLLSCDKQLDIEPTQFISKELALSDDQGVKTALMGAYDLLSVGWNWGTAGARSEEIYADTGNLIWTGSALDREIFYKEINVQNSSVWRHWEEGYELINLCNTIIESVDNVNPDDKLKVEGEARFIRAGIYFNLVNYFGKTWVDGDPEANLGVPLLLSSTKSTDDLDVSRATVAEIYERIIKDLEYSKASLPVTNGVFATTYSASGLLSRVFLMQEAFEAAAIEANRVIASGLYALQPNFASAFNQSNNTLEDIFTIIVTLQGRPNYAVAIYAGGNAGGSGNITITDNHMTLYETDDQRGALFYFDNFSIRRTGKWVQNLTQDGNVNIMRLSEMYLTRSECRFQTGDIDGAVEDINMVRARVGASLFDSSNLTLEAIWKERYLELCFEGHLLRDFKRTRRDFGDIPFDDFRMVFPIPQREMDLNGLLVQNPGY